MLVALLGAVQDTCASKVDVDFDGHVVCASYGQRLMGAPRSCCAGCRWWSRRIAVVCFLVVFFLLKAQGKCEVFSSSTCTQDMSRCVDMHPPLRPRHMHVHTPSRSHRSPLLQCEVVFFRSCCATPKPSTPSPIPTTCGPCAHPRRVSSRTMTQQSMRYVTDHPFIHPR